MKESNESKFIFEIVTFENDEFCDTFLSGGAGDLTSWSQLVSRAQVSNISLSLFLQPHLKTLNVVASKQKEASNGNVGHSGFEASRR